MPVRRLQNLEIDFEQEPRQLVLDPGHGLGEIRKVAVQEFPVSTRFRSARVRESAERGLSCFEIAPRARDEERRIRVLARQPLGGDERLLEEALAAAVGRFRRQARNELQGDGSACDIVILDRHRFDRRFRERSLSDRGFPAGRRPVG